MDERGPKIFSPTSAFSPRMKPGAGGPGVKLEVAAGDFSPLVSHPKPTKGDGDFVTEFVTGASDAPWGVRQQTNAKTLSERGAMVATDVDMTNPEHLRSLTGDLPIRKIKAENVHAPAGDKDEAHDVSGLLHGVFDAASKTLAKGGVVEYGMTGPAVYGDDWSKASNIKNKHAFTAATHFGFEPVEVRSNMTGSHTFSQQDRGVPDLRRTQVVFARAGEADAVRAHYQGKQASKLESGVPLDPLKMRQVVPSGSDAVATMSLVKDHHNKLGGD